MGDGNLRIFKKNNRKIKERKPESKKAKIIRYTILAVMICVFLFSAYQLITIYLEYKQGSDEYEAINEVFDDSDDGTDSETTEETQEEWSWNYEAMLEINDETKGWIKQDDILSYPILQTDNNEYYLTHLANNKSNKAGSIFIDYQITEGLEAKNCIVYGHNMKNKTMFGSLMGYYEEAYYKEHPSFDVYIAEKLYRYEVFAAYETPEVSDTYAYGFDSDDAFKQYLDTSREKSIYSTDFRELTASDKIITLSTCTEDDDTKRFIVQIVRVEEVAY